MEIAVAGADGKPAGYGKQFPIDQLNVTYFDYRLRLGSDPDHAAIDHWFEFGPKSYEAPTAVPPYDHFERIAADVISYLETQAEEWFERQAERGLT